MTWLAFGRTPRAKKPGTSAYDAFISYSHALDGRLAPALQSALHRFTKPWLGGSCDEIGLVGSSMSMRRPHDVD